MSVAVLGVVLLVGGALIIATRASSASAGPDPTRGAAVFATAFTPAQGLGPLFNNTSCLACHNTPTAGGGGPEGLATVLRIGRLTGTGGFDPMLDRGGPFARAHAVSELGVSCELSPGVPAGANLTSVRNAPMLFSAGQIDAVPDAAILAGAKPRRDGIRGRPNLVNGRVGRFGWKGDTVSLRQFVGEAFRNEMGLTTPVAPNDFVPAGACGALTGTPEVSGSIVADVVAYIDRLSPPSRPAGTAGEPTVFNQVGCGECHVPALGGQTLYSDLLLHDMGRALDDAVVQASASGKDWRTTPLVAVGQRSRFLHDGRARSLEAAILTHGGEAEPAVQRFRDLPPALRDELLAFLSML